MRIDEIGEQACSVAKSLAQIGDAWSILIVREAMYGRTHFSDFVRHTGAQKTVVSARLKTLVDARILKRVPYSESPPRYEYRLTLKGRDLAPALLALVEWGDRWIEPENGTRLEFRHECGERVGTRVLCPSCGEMDHDDVIVAHAGPGYPDGLAVPAPGTRNRRGEAD